MSDTFERIKTAKASRARKRKADELAITSTEPSTAITPLQLQDRTELDNTPFHRAQMHAASAKPNTQLPSDHPSNTTTMVNSSGTPTSAPSASQPKATGIPTRTRPTQEEQISTPGPDRHQVLRDLFRTRSSQTQEHDNTTEPRSLPPNPQPPKSSTPRTSTPPTASPSEEPLEEIDLRSPHDDPDYDIISPHEAVHSSRNAQADHASKYPQIKPQAKHPQPKPKPQRSSSSTSASALHPTTPRQGFESDDSGEGEESDSDFTSWRSYDFVRKTEAKHSARNAQADRACKYPELVKEKGEGDGGGRGGGGGVEKGKGWLEWLLS
jgi:hypothetical protein